MAHRCDISLPPSGFRARVSIKSYTENHEKESPTRDAEYPVQPTVFNENLSKQTPSLGINFSSESVGLHTARLRNEKITRLFI